jgi:hypothetical protein
MAEAMKEGDQRQSNTKDWAREQEEKRGGDHR